MNYLIIILAVIFFFKNFNNNKSGAIGNINFSDLTPLLNLASECGLLNNFPLSSIENILGGNFNFSELLPLIFSFFNGFSSDKQAQNNNACADVTACYCSENENGLSPITDVFSSDFTTLIDDYFKS